MKEIEAIKTLVDKGLHTKEEGYDLIVKLFAEEETAEVSPSIKESKKRKYKKSKKHKEGKSEFSDKDDKYIKDHFATDKIVDIAKVLKKDAQKVYPRLHKLGLSKWKKKSKQQEVEAKELTNNLREPKEEKKPDKLKSWSESDDQFIIENYGLVSVDEIAKHLKRETSSVTTRINDLEKIGKIK